MKTLFKSIWVCVALLCWINGFVYAYTDIDFVDSNNGWAIVNGYSGEPMVIHTSDGGQDWVIQRRAGEENEYYGYDEYYVCIDFVSPTEGWIVLDNGSVLHTNDGGNTWNVQANVAELWMGETAGEEYLSYIINFVDANNGWIIVTNESGNVPESVLFHTSDGGQSWTVKESGKNEAYMGMYFVSPTEGWITELNIQQKGLTAELWSMIYHTTDGGNTLTIQEKEKDGFFGNVQFINPNEGWVIGYNSFMIPSIFHTIDGGSTWVFESNLDIPLVDDLCFVDSNIGWASGGEILHTIDGGKTWVKQYSELEALSAYFLNSNEGWVIAEYADIIIHTNDGGNTWKTQWKDKGPLPQVESVSIKEGQKIPGNIKNITVEFSKLMESVEIKVSDTEGTTKFDVYEYEFMEDSINKRKAIWTPTTFISPGPHTLMIIGKDEDGQDLDGFVPINFIAVESDTTPPEIDNSASEPNNGATDVEPTSVKNIKIVFNEPMSFVKLDSFEPRDAKVNPVFDGDRTLNIYFLGGYKISKGQEVKVGLNGEDLVGNKLKTTLYTFKTISSVPTQDDFSHVFYLSLIPGLNMVSLPLKPVTPYTVSSFAKELSATVVIRYNEEKRKFEGFVPNSPGNDFTIEGGKGYIVNVPKGGTFKFAGAAWENEPPAQGTPPDIEVDDTWAFVINGSFDKTGSYTVSVKNLNTGALSTEMINTNGYFAVVYADMNRKAVVNVGDRLEITVTDGSGKLVSGPFIREIIPNEIRNVLLNVNPRFGDIIPASTMLLQNYPNPFNPETWIPYQLKYPNEVVIKILNVTGELVRELRLGYKPAGTYMTQDKAVYWDGRNEVGEQVSSGVYFYTIRAGDYNSTKKMIITR